MTTFQIINLRSGYSFGAFEGADKAEACAAMLNFAGYNVRAQDGELVFPDEETAKLCGDLGEVWAVFEAEAPA